MIEIDKLIRQLAKSTKYQTLYSQAKEAGFSLFKNRSDLTNIQITLINYICFYNTIQTDVATGEVNEELLKSDICEESYMYYKSKMMKKQDKNPMRMVQSQPESDTKKVTKSSWIFKPRPRK